MVDQICLVGCRNILLRVGRSAGICAKKPWNIGSAKKRLASWGETRLIRPKSYLLVYQLVTLLVYQVGYQVGYLTPTQSTIYNLLTYNYKRRVQRTNLS